jgi:TolA-binding protein
MRKILFTVAAAASALAFAAPASAQNYPGQYYPGQQAPYGNAYGYNNYGHVRSLQAHIDQVQRQISRLDQRNILSEREAYRLRNESRDIERQLRYMARNGLNPNEANSINYRINRLEQRVAYEARDGNRWGRNDRRDNWSDRDRDGRNDRWEDDGGYRHD